MPGGQTLKVAILGTTGSGKSTLAAEIIQERDRVLVLDTMGDYDELPGAIVCEGAEECISQLLDLQYKKHWILVCLTLEIQEGLDILAVGFDIPDITIVVDECSMYCNPHFLPEEFARLIRYSRKRNIDLIFLARRPSEVHREVTAQANLLVTFIQYEPIDIVYLRSRMGPKAERAKSLKQYAILVHSDKYIMENRVPLAILKRMEEEKDLTEEEEPE